MRFSVSKRCPPGGKKVTIFSKSFVLSRPFRDCLAASLIWALSAAFCIPIFAASSAATTSNNLAALHVEQRNADEALQYIAFKSGLIIGVENCCVSRRRQGRHRFSGGTVADLLNAFTNQAPGFRWQQDGDGIHVFRKSAAVPLADVVLAYPGANKKNRMQIWMQIHESPEVKRWVAANNCVDVGRFGPYAFLRVKNSRDSISIAPGKMTLSRLLDKTAAQTGVVFFGNFAVRAVG
jgi:hypothetical protein